MDPDFDLRGIGYPGQVARLVELLDNVWQDHVPVTIAHNGVVVAIAVNPEELDLLRHQLDMLAPKQSGESRTPGEG